MNPTLKGKLISKNTGHLPGSNGKELPPASREGAINEERTHMELRSSEIRYRRLFEAARDGILILDPNTRKITDANPFMSELLGYLHRELLGKELWEIGLLKDEEANQAIFRELTKNNYVRYEDLPLQSKTGESHEVEFVSNLYVEDGRTVIQCNIRDITERKKAAQRVTLLDTCIAKLHDIILITEAVPLEEPGPKIVFVNSAFERITGYTPAEAIGRSPRFLQGEKTDRHILREIRQALEQNQPIRRQVVNYRKDGSDYLMDIDMVPVLDAGGKCSHFVAIEHDVTGEVRADQMLRESERRYREVLENVDLIALTVDRVGIITFCNDYLLELTGWTRDELMGSDCFQKLVPETEEEVRRFFYENLAVGNFPSHYQNLIKTKKGELRRICWSNTVMRDEAENIIGLTGIGEDITDEEKAREQLLWKTAFFEANIRSSLDGILIVDNEGRKILQNQLLTDLWGVPQEFADDPDDSRQLEWVTKQVKDPIQFARNVAHLYAHPDEVGHDEIELINGKVFDRYSSPVQGEDGKRYGRIWSFRDVTDRKRAEESLKLFRALIEQSNDAVEVIDSETGRFLDLNERAWKRLGYSREEMLLMTVADIASDAPPVSEMVKLTQKFAFKIVEGQHRRKDGSTFPVEISVKYIQLDRAYLVAVVRDITERKQVEKEMRAGEERYRSTLDNMAEGCQIIGFDWSYLYLNNQAARHNRQPNQELLGRKMTDVWPGIETSAVFLLLERCMKERIAVHQEIEFNFPDGKKAWFDVRSQPVPEGIFVLSLDIAERKSAQEQIAEQASLLDKAQDAIIVRDLQGAITFWNKGAERMYGWTRLEALGRNIGEFLYADPKKFEEINRLTLSTGEWHGEFAHITKDRSELTVEARWTLIRNSEGQPKSVLAIYTDITEKKKVEAQFLRAQRMESIGTLAAGIAHDLNNILAPIMMSIDILKLTATNPQAKSVLETISVSAKRGSDIVRQVLSFARGLEGERVEIQPRHLLNDLEHIIKDTFPKDIRLEFSIPNNTWTILGDPTQVHQVLLNLCVNARDAMPNGGQLTINIENCTLDEQYAAMNVQVKAGRYVKIGVTDTGMGIPVKVIDKIFEPFFTTKDINKGTGLGLSTVMAIVKSHGGTINVYSEPGKGTCFTIYLPAMENSSEAKREQTEQANLPRGNGETILVIDDEASIRTITSQTLQAFGYKVMTAIDGAEALGIYVQQKTEIAVVLTDMMMPVMDGPATIRALMRINPAIKIIGASGLNMTEAMTKASGAGVKHFLTKPYTAGTLLKAMRLILDES
jgi:PAS domain S-box-containing protein